MKYSHHEAKNVNKSYSLLSTNKSKLVDINRNLINKLPINELKELYKVHMNDLYPDASNIIETAKKDKTQKIFIFTPIIKHIINTVAQRKISTNVELTALLFLKETNTIISGGTDCNIYQWSLDNGTMTGKLLVI